MLIEFLEHKETLDVKKCKLSFFINQFHLWNNSMFLERIFFFSFFYLYTFLYLYIYFLLFVYIYFSDTRLLWLLDVQNEAKFEFSFLSFFPSIYAQPVLW